MSSRHDHKIRTHFDEATGNLTSLTWTNELDQEDAPGDFPSQIVQSPEGTLISAFWKRRGKMHRDNDLPAAIYFDDAGLPDMWCWYQHGLEHREGGKPASIHFADGSLTSLVAIEFFENGQFFREGGKPESYFFDDKGKAFESENIGSEEVLFEGFDPNWLPSPVPTIAVPQLFLLNTPKLKP